MEFINKIASNMDSFLAGLIGAAISVQFNKQALLLWRRIFWFCVTGGTIAHFTTGALVKFFSVQPDNAGTVAFIIGAVGYSLLAAITRAITESDLWGLFKSIVQTRFGKGSGNAGVDE